MGYTVVFNDFSLAGQFVNLEGFIECLRNNLQSVFYMMEDNDIELMKGYRTFERFITKDITLVDLMKEGGNPVISVFMNFLIKLAFKEPYWDTDPRTDKSVEYEYSDKGDEPNCITEAIERDLPLLSFIDKKTDFKNRYQYVRNGQPGELANIVDSESFLIMLLKHSRSSIRYVMEHYPFKGSLLNVQNVEICTSNMELLEGTQITDEDIYKIIKNINNLISDKQTGTKSHWWDDLGDGLNEYRVSISAGREFRWFFIWGEKVRFLNSFIKKTQETPQRELDRARRLMSVLRR